MERLQLRRRTQLRSIDIDQTQATAVRQHLLIAFGEWNVSGPVRDDEYLQQRQARCDRPKPLFVDRREDRIEHWQKARMFLDEVNEDDRIEREGAIAYLADQSHDLRSTST